MKTFAANAAARWPAHLPANLSEQHSNVELFSIRVHNLGRRRRRRRRRCHQLFFLLTLCLNQISCRLLALLSRELHWRLL